MFSVFFPFIAVKDFILKYRSKWGKKGVLRTSKSRVKNLGGSKLGAFLTVIFLCGKSCAQTRRVKISFTQSVVPGHNLGNKPNTEVF